MLPQQLVCKYELNCEYRNITLARNKAPWWWSDKIETCRSVLKCFMWNYMCICWLINCVCFEFPYKDCLKYFSFRKELAQIFAHICTHLHVSSRDLSIYYSCQFLKKLEFSKRVSKNIEYKFSWKSIQRTPGCPIRTDRQTDIRKLTVAFRNFTKVPKIISHKNRLNMTKQDGLTL